MDSSSIFISPSDFYSSILSKLAETYSKKVFSMQDSRNPLSGFNHLFNSSKAEVIETINQGTIVKDS
jgi:hypothetical protein